MGTLSERDAMIQELVRLDIANRLMDEEMKRLQPDLKKYENCIHPASRPIPTESVSTSSLNEKTMVIKEDTSKLKVIENDLKTLNNRVTTVFNEVEEKISQRNSLFSELEQVTSMMNSLTVSSPRFEEDAVNIRNTLQNESCQFKSMTISFQDRVKDKLAKLAALQKTKTELDRNISDMEEKAKVLHARKAEYTSKIDLDYLAKLKADLDDLNEKTAKLNEYLVTVTKDEGQQLESLTASITECESLKQKKEELCKQLEEVNAREEETVLAMDGKKKEVEESQNKLNELKSKREMHSKNHERVLSELKERSDPLIESLKGKKEAAEKELCAVKERIKVREECLMLRKELEALGKIEPLDLSKEIESLKQEIGDVRANITKTISEAEYYGSVAANVNAEADELQLSDRRRREEEERIMHEKDGVANHYEKEIFLLKKKLERERIAREDKIAQETRRLLEKAKEDKERKDKEEKRRVEKEKEKEKEKEREKIRKMKEAEEKKAKRAKEDQLKKKKEEEKNRLINAVQNKDSQAAIISRVQQRRMNMEAAAASIPMAYHDGPLMKPPPAQPPARPQITLRSHSIPKKSMYVYDDDSSEDDEDEMSDFFLDDSTRTMPKVPQQYAGSPPRVDKHMTPLNPFELSFADVQSSTPARTQNDPTPMLELSFNQVVTSTPQISKGSKTNKKTTRARGKKRT